jgi:hypothetical protein
MIARCPTLGWFNHPRSYTGKPQSVDFASLQHQSLFSSHCENLQRPPAVTKSISAPLYLINQSDVELAGSPTTEVAPHLTKTVAGFSSRFRISDRLTEFFTALQHDAQMNDL